MKLIKILILVLTWTAVSAQETPSITDQAPPDSLDLNVEQLRQKFKDVLSRHMYYHSYKDREGYFFIHDYEKILTEEEENILDSIVTDFEKRTSIEIAIVTLDTLLVAKKDFEDLTLLIANKWEIGKQDKNNGILIGICTAYRKIRIQNGLGIEKIITDQQTKNVIDTEFIPYFKKGEYFNGIKAGLLAIMNLLQ